MIVLTKIFNNILSFLTNKKNREFILLGGIILLIILLLSKCNKVKYLNQKNEQNLAAMKGEMETIINKKDSTMTYQKATFLVNEKELKKLNEDMYKELKAQSGKVSSINKGSFTFKPNKLILDNRLIKHNDGTLGLEFKDSSEFNIIEGITNFSVIQSEDRVDVKPGKTFINRNEFKMELIYGLKEEKGVYKVFANPKNPNIVVTNIEGYLIDPNMFQSETILSKPKKHGIGFNIGYGAQLGRSGTSFGPNISIGYNYNIIRF